MPSCASTQRQGFSETRVTLCIVQMIDRSYEDPWPLGDEAELLRNRFFLCRCVVAINAEEI